MRQLQEKRFPNIYWLRLPDPFELDVLLDITLAPQQRVMALWRTTVLPAVLDVCKRYNYSGAMVVEDTVLLRPDVTDTDVASEIQKTNAPAGVWGHGKYWEEADLQGNLRCGWSGTKGLWMTPAWCEEIAVMLENTHFQDYKHVDMWLVGLLKQEKARGFVLYPAFAGYGHRVSMSTADHGCLLYTSPSPRDRQKSRMPSSA